MHGHTQNKDARTAAKRRLTQLQQQYPHKLPHTLLLYWGTLLPTYTNTLTPKAFRANFPEGIDIIIAGLPDYPPTTQTTRHPTHLASREYTKEYSKNATSPRQFTTHRNRVNTSQYPKQQLHPHRHTRMVNPHHHFRRPPMRLRGTKRNTIMPKHNT